MGLLSNTKPSSAHFPTFTWLKVTRLTVPAPDVVRSDGYQRARQHLAYIIDDALVFYGSAQLMTAQDGTLMTATVDLKALHIADPKYVYAISVMNLCIILLFLTTTLLTNGWTGLLSFTYVDGRSVVVGTSMSGGAIGNAMREAHQVLGSAWTGDEADRVVGQIPVVGYRDVLALLPQAATYSEVPVDFLEGGQSSSRQRQQTMSESVEGLLQPDEADTEGGIKP